MHHSHFSRMSSCNIIKPYHILCSIVDLSMNLLVEVNKVLQLSAERIKKLFFLKEEYLNTEFLALTRFPIAPDFKEICSDVNYKLHKV